MNALILVWLLVAQSVIVAAAGGAVFLAARWLFPHDWPRATAAALACFGVLSLATFWLAWWSYAALGVLRVLLGMALGAALIAIALRARDRLRDLRPLAEPAVLSLLWATLTLSWGFAAGDFGHPQLTPATRFSHELPVDNYIPLILANALRHGQLASPLYGDWLASDRPPLQAGLFLLLKSPGGNHQQIYLVFASLLQATFLFGTWALCRALDLSAAARRLVLVACLALPTTLVNTLYAWPKMMPIGALLLLAAFFFAAPADERRYEATDGVLVGGLAATAALAHGTSVFFLAGIAIAALVGRRHRSLRFVASAAAATVLCYLPWMAFPAWVDPPGNRLLKWHFAGIGQVDPRGTIAALSDAYGALTLPAFLHGKWENVLALVGTFPHNFALAYRFVRTGAPEASAALRAQEFFHFLPSLQLYAVALAISLSLFVLVPGARGPRALARAYPGLLGAWLCATALFVLLMFIPGSTVNHQGSYASQMIVVVLAMAHLASLSGLLARIILAAQAALMAVVYGHGLPQPPSSWGLTAIAIASAAALLAAGLIPGPIARGARPRRGAGENLIGNGDSGAAGQD